MTEKRFKLHIIWYNKEKTEGEAELTDNGQPLLCTEYIYDARLLKNLLNELNDENEQLKSSFTEFAKRIEFDIDNGIEVYPKRLLEYIINISKEYGK